MANPIIISGYHRGYHLRQDSTPRFSLCWDRWGGKLYILTARPWPWSLIIPARKLGKSWHFVMADLLAWLRGKEQTDRPIG